MIKLRKLLPSGCRQHLFGDRNSFGKLPDLNDKDWVIWKEKSISDFFENTQKRGIGNWVCNLAYPVVAKINFNGKSVLEIGPGDIRHLNSMNSQPESYTICDIEEKCLDMSKKRLDQAGVPNKKVLLEKSSVVSFPFANEEFDVIISFNTLEHLYPLDNYLTEMSRVIKRDGLLIGGIPREGGLAWGLGRFLTTRRYVHKNYGINYDKIICWEHPNFIDFIIDRLDAHFEGQYFNFYPFPWFPMDFNLVASFIYKKSH